MNSPSNVVTRRSFLLAAGIATAAMPEGCSSNGVSTGVPTSASPYPIAPTTNYVDNDYLNFALNLEYLEAEFLLRAATGSGLSAGDAGTGAGTVTGGAQVTGLSAVQQQFLYEAAQNEVDHVRLLRGALGSAAVARPAIDFTVGFSSLAIAAGVVASGKTFNAFASATNFLLGAFAFEDVGVTAYHGAARLLTSKTLLGTAARIHAVEAYHAAFIRSQIVLQSALDPTSPILQNANQISAIRGALGGGAETALSATSVVAADPANAIGFGRTTDQVLHILYATANGSNVKSGGFFPSGLNGNISVTFS